MSDLADASVEMTIRAEGAGYRTILQKDGVCMDRKLLASQQQVAAWASAVMGLVGQNLYVRLQSKGGHHLRQMLDLALTLSRAGLIIGLTRETSVCRTPSGHLQ